MGIGIGIREILFREFATGSLIEPFPETVPAPCPFYMIWPASTDGHPDFAAFRQWIRREVHGMTRFLLHGADADMTFRRRRPPMWRPSRAGAWLHRAYRAVAGAFG